jgi:hypothetical protein
MASTFPSLVLASPVASPPWAARAAGDGIGRIGLARAPATLAIRPVDLDDCDLVAQEMSGEPGPIAARPFDADKFERAETLEPAKEPAIARSSRREAFDAEKGTSFVKRSSDVDVEVRIDSSGNAARESGHRHPFLR